MRLSEKIFSLLMALIFLSGILWAYWNERKAASRAPDGTMLCSTDGRAYVVGSASFPHQPVRCPEHDNECEALKK